MIKQSGTGNTESCGTRRIQTVKPCTKSLPGENGLSLKYYFTGQNIPCFRNFCFSFCFCYTVKKKLKIGNYLKNKLPVLKMIFLKRKSLIIQTLFIKFIRFFIHNTSEKITKECSPLEHLVCSQQFGNRIRKRACFNVKNKRRVSVEIKHALQVVIFTWFTGSLSLFLWNSQLLVLKITFLRENNECLRFFQIIIL